MPSRTVKSPICPTKPSTLSLQIKNQKVQAADTHPVHHPTPLL